VRPALPKASNPSTPPCRGGPDQSPRLQNRNVDRTPSQDGLLTINLHRFARTALSIDGQRATDPGGVDSHELRWRPVGTRYRFRTRYRRPLRPSAAGTQRQPPATTSTLNRPMSSIVQEKQRDTSQTRRRAPGLVAALVTGSVPRPHAVDECGPPGGGWRSGRRLAQRSRGHRSERLPSELGSHGLDTGGAVDALS
jgi:hypothetical protein